MMAELIAGAALLAAQLCVSWYGWVTLPADARVPIHFGPGAYNNFVSKKAGLIMHPAGGVVLFVITVAVSKSGSANSSSAPAFLVIAMAVVLVTQCGAIWVARRRSGQA
jgi:uncharacterized membrane protein